ncbi:MAG: hypothetical protein R3B90_21805 [Planctomycetaceae bacterium]
MNDALLFYNFGDWSRYGLAVPNWSDDTHSQNETIRHIVEVTGRNLQAVMWHTDAMLRVPPTINTLGRIHALCVRARSILAARAVAPGTAMMEPTHAVPAPEVFKVYPTPYFKVRNPWLKQYAGLILTGLTEAMQHTDNARPLEISQDFSSRFGQYVQRVYRLMAIELLRVTDGVDLPTFTLTNEQLAAYDPTKWFTSTELIDTVPPIDDRPTEDTLRVLTDGIPVTQLPNLGPWPSSVNNAQAAASNQGTGEAFAPVPGF